MSFDLRIEFSGLCLFVVHPEGQQVGVAVADALQHSSKETMKHSDGSAAEPHAGYLRFDLGNLLPGVTPASNNSESPFNEAVHRFNREWLEIDDMRGNALANINVDHLEFPDFG